MKIILFAICLVIIYSAGVYVGWKKGTVHGKNEATKEYDKNLDAMADANKKMNGGIEVNGEVYETVDIPMASDAAVLSDLSISNGYLDCPEKRRVLNEMKKEINEAISAGNKFTPFSTDLQLKIQKHFRRYELELIFSELGYKLKFSPTNRLQWICWDENYSQALAQEIEAHSLAAICKEI